MPSWAQVIVEAAGHDPLDVARAREAARGAGVDPRLADGLLACVGPVTQGAPSAEVAAAARALAALVPG